MTERLFYENEVKNNRITAGALAAIGGLFILLAAAGKAFENFVLGIPVIGVLMLIAGILDIGAFAAACVQRYENRWTKYFILAGILVSSEIVFFFYPLKGVFLCYGPLLISAVYYDTRLIKQMSVISFLAYSALLWANVVLDKTNSVMHAFNEIQGIAIWQYPDEVLKYHYLPSFVFFAITGFICYSLAGNGRKLVVRQAEDATKAAAVESELKTAAAIQFDSLPATPFVTGDGKARLEAFMRPAKTVGGDFYDYFMLGEKTVFLIADVSDKGLPAAMFMMRAKNAVRFAVSSGKSLEEAFSYVNGELCRDNETDMFVTLWLGMLDTRTGFCSYVNCGHMPPVIRRADGAVERVGSSPDIVLGAFADAVFHPHEIQLHPGDVLFLFTDGLTDASDAAGAFFGDVRLVNTVTGAVESGAAGLCGRVVAEIDSFSRGAGQFDDMTCLSLIMTETRL